MTLPELAFFSRLLSACATLALVATQAQALPVVTDASVVNGSASFAEDASALTITTTPGSIIDWSDFSIGVGETVTVLQPSASSATLVRVTSGGLLTINGNLISNGGLVFVTQGGLNLGAEATFQAPLLALLTYSTISDADFLAGNFGFPVGSSAIIGSGAVAISGLSVPEPATYAMMLAALAALATVGRRKQHPKK